MIIEEATEALQNPEILRNCIATLKLTKNKSFRRMAYFLKKKFNIKNWAWPGLTYDKDLIGKDPFDSTMSDAMKIKWICELLRNPVIFFREFIRCDGSEFNLNRANAALMFLCMNNQSLYEIIARQCGKTTAMIAMLCYIDLFRSINKDTMLVGKGAKNISDMLERFKAIKGELPKWITQIYPKSLDGTIGKDNTTQLDNVLTNNKLIGLLSATSEVAADAKPRGYTTPRIVYDEHPFIDNIESFELSAASARAEAAIRAIEQGEPTFTAITTTAGNRNTKSGSYSYDIFINSVRFREEFYDYTSSQLEDILDEHNVDTFAIQYSWQQLGKSVEWYKDRIKKLKNKQRQINIDVLNVWNYDDLASAFEAEIMNAVREHTINPVKVLKLNSGSIKLTNVESYDNGKITEEDVFLKIYKEARDIPCIITLDTGSGRGGDYHAINVIDASSGEQYATMLNNTMSNDDLTRVILYLFEYYPKSILIAELNFMGEPVVRKIREKTNSSHRIFRFKNKDYTTDVIKKKDGMVSLGVKKSNNITYGINTTSRTRPLYFDILRDTIMMSPEIFKSKDLEGQISKLVVKTTANGERIDHEVGEHDDLVMSYCVGLYAIRYHKSDIQMVLGPIVNNIDSARREKLRQEYVQEHTIFAKFKGYDDSKDKTPEELFLNESYNSNLKIFNVLQNTNTNNTSFITGNSNFNDSNVSKINNLYTEMFNMY